MMLNSKDGEALVTTRAVADPLAYFMVVQARWDALADWRRLAPLIAIIVATTGLFLLLLGLAFHAQYQRAHAADLINSRVASTIDAALERGRCGLWDWDVVQGRIYWSASMFEMLGLEMKDPIISYGSLIDLMHPDDPGLLASAERVLHGLEEAIERDFRLRQADGNWLWVRIRGKRVVDDLSGMTHIVGIAIDISGERAAQSQSEILDGESVRPLRRPPNSLSFGMVMTVSWLPTAGSVSCLRSTAR